MWMGEAFQVVGTAHCESGGGVKCMQVPGDVWGRAGLGVGRSHRRPLDTCGKEVSILSVGQNPSHLSNIVCQFRMY